MTSTQSETPHYDAIVVGSGISGGWATKLQGSEVGQVAYRNIVLTPALSR